MIVPDSRIEHEVLTCHYCKTMQLDWDIWVVELTDFYGGSKQLVGPGRRPASWHMSTERCREEEPKR
jgi:hypothetical protein